MSCTAELEPITGGGTPHGSLWISLLVALVGVFAYGVAKGATAADDGALLKAINFALTGSDRITYSFTDRSTCVVSWKHPSAQDGIDAVDTFYLNNIELSRARWQEMETKTLAFGTTRFIRVQLHGEAAIRSNGFVPASTTLTANDVTLDLNTAEHDRLVRAWRYIYAHGCKSAQSSY